MNFGLYLLFALLGCAGIAVGIIRKRKFIWIPSVIIVAVFGFLCLCTILLIGGID